MNILFVLLLHGGDDRVDLIYFWSSILTVLLPVGVFILMAVLFFRAYARRTDADGGGAPPVRKSEVPTGTLRP